MSSKTSKATLVSATALAMCAGAAEAQRSSPINKPDWVTIPSGKDFEEYYPKHANFLEVDGRARLSCTVNVKGELENCTTPFEQPVGLGFGAAALAMTKKFAMRPGARNGIPIDGATVAIPIRFVLPEPKNGPPPPPAAGESLRNALRITDAHDAVTVTLDNIYKEHATAYDRGVTTGTRAIVIEVLEKAWQTRRPELRIAYANALASVFRESELASIADFAEGSGKALNYDRRLQDIQKTIGASLPTILGPSAKAAFCAKNSCPAPADLARVWRAIEPSDDRIDNPQWSNSPTEGAVSAAAPVPTIIGLRGAVRLTCQLGKEGTVTVCTVDEELPQGLGFGAAAQGLATRYRLSPIQAATATEGRKVTLRVGFSPPPAGGIYKAPDGVSDRAITLATKILEDQGSVETLMKNLEVQIEKRRLRPPAGVDQAQYDAMLEALRVGYRDAFTAGLDINARVLASELGEEKLAAVVAFRASSVGRSFEVRKDEIDAAINAASAPIASAVASQARADYCKLRSCVSVPNAQPNRPDR